MSKQGRSGRSLKRFQRLKKRLMEKSDRRCFYCKIEMVPGVGAVNDADNTMTVDHLLPRADGGSDDESNLVVCCQKCNRSRGRKAIKEFLLQTHPWRLYPKVK